MTITVFWQPGCTSCLHTKEFLRVVGIETDLQRLDVPVLESRLLAQHGLPPPADVWAAEVSLR